MSRIFLSFARNNVLRSSFNIRWRLMSFSNLPNERAFMKPSVKLMENKMKINPMNIITRKYSHVPLTIESVSDRIMLNLRCFDKIDPEKVTLDSNLMKDMGIDSLDHVEVIMAVEEEFGFEIPDQEAVKLNTPREIIQYVCDKLDVYE